MLRVGIEESVDDGLLSDLSGKVDLVRIPTEPRSEVEIDFWISPMPLRNVEIQLPHLRGVRVVQALSAGVDLFLKVLPSGITLCDASGVHDVATAEWTVAVILAMQKYLQFYAQLQRQEDWSGRLGSMQLYLQSHGMTAPLDPPVLVDEVAGATVLIVGYGSIGAAVEMRLAPFGVKVLRVARSAREGVEPVSRLDELLPEADIAVLTLPLTSETRHLLNASRLARMKHGALVVNVSRGQIVDMEALLAALIGGRLRAALDVTDPEPLPSGHPLWRAPNLLITPHVAGSSGQALKRALKLASAQVLRYVRGEPLLNIVTDGY